MRHFISLHLSSLASREKKVSDNGALGALCYKAQALLTMQSHSLGQERAYESVKAYL